MSVTLRFRPLKETPPTLSCSAPGRFYELAARILGEPGEPWEFGDEHVERIRGMLIIGTGVDDTLRDLIGLIAAHGRVLVWRET